MQLDELKNELRYWKYSFVEIALIILELEHLLKLSNKTKLHKRSQNKILRLMNRASEILNEEVSYMINEAEYAELYKKLTAEFDRVKSDYKYKPILSGCCKKSQDKQAYLD
ncbi:MAG: hypothetical protein ACQESF_02595 [Nanobdellota archaeon]